MAPIIENLAIVSGSNYISLQWTVNPVNAFTTIKVGDRGPVEAQRYSFETYSHNETELKPGRKYEVILTPHIDKIYGDREIRQVIILPLPPSIELSKPAAETEFYLNITRNGDFEDCTSISFSISPLSNDDLPAPISCQKLLTVVEFEKLEPGTEYKVSAVAIQDDLQSEPEILTVVTKPAKPQLIAQDLIEATKITMLTLSLSGLGLSVKYCLEEVEPLKNNCQILDFQHILRISLNDQYYHKKIQITTVGLDNERSESLIFIVGVAVFMNVRVGKHYFAGGAKEMFYEKMGPLNGVNVYDGNQKLTVQECFFNQEYCKIEIPENTLSTTLSAEAKFDNTSQIQFDFYYEK